MLHRAPQHVDGKEEQGEGVTCSHPPQRTPTTRPMEAWKSTEEIRTAPKIEKSHSLGAQWQRLRHCRCKWRGNEQRVSGSDRQRDGNCCLREARGTELLQQSMGRHTVTDAPEQATFAECPPKYLSGVSSSHECFRVFSFPLFAPPA